VLSVSFQTLGCKLNQFETESLAEAFRHSGFSLSPPPGKGPVLVILNTCTVTSRAEQKARRCIRRALRDNPRSCLIVTGCYAQLDRDALKALEGESPDYAGRLFVAGGNMKGVLLDLPLFLREAGPGGADRLPGLLRDWMESRPVPDSPGADRFRFNPGSLSFHSRAFLKIQDGCDRRCSYCRVSLARGPAVSLPAETALARLRELEEAGYGETVITGVNISRWRDGGGRGGLPFLLRRILEGSRTIALRLSSLEPGAVTPELGEILSHPRIRPHFHLSVQSGSPLILEMMRRPYGPGETGRAAALLRSVKEDPFLACDIIAGFPGETGEEFEKTRLLCRDTGFAWIHAFPYSPRPGTEAYDFGKPVPEREAAGRVEALLSLAREGRRSYCGRWVGRTVAAVVQARDKKDPEYSGAVSDNYLRLKVKTGPGMAPGGTADCRITAPAEEGAAFDALAELVPAVSGAAD
jgi:threonylcarbamoyladenosine tRNA methylthiotransferase MtaB